MVDFLGDPSTSQDRGKKGARGKLIDSGVEVWNGPDATRFHEFSGLNPEVQRMYSSEGDPPEEAGLEVPDGDRVKPPPPVRRNRTV